MQFRSGIAVAVAISEKEKKKRKSRSLKKGDKGRNGDEKITERAVTDWQAWQLLGHSNHGENRTPIL